MDEVQKGEFHDCTSRLLQTNCFVSLGKIEKKKKKLKRKEELREISIVLGIVVLAFIWMSQCEGISFTHWGKVNGKCIAYNRSEKGTMNQRGLRLH